MTGFLDSFSSEFRNLTRVEKSGQTKNDIGEIIKTEGTRTTIRGILFENKKSNFLKSLIDSQVNYDKSDRKLRYGKQYTINKDDIIIDEYGTEYKVIKTPKKVISFGAVYDHNMASLELIE